MPILLGTEMKAKSGAGRGVVEWHPDRTINGHGLIVGASGVGKTHRLKMITQGIIENYGARVIVIDVHGDIEIPGEKRVKFSESTAFGLNPLKINPDRYSGGVRRRIRSFLAMINRSGKLGSRQEAALARLLEDLYDRNGFDPMDWRTWDPLTNPNVRGRSAAHGVYPNISDLKKFTASKLKMLKTGAGGEAFKVLTELSKVTKALNKKTLKLHGETTDVDDDDDDGGQSDEMKKLEKLKGKAKDTYCAFVEAVRTGDEINDLLRYNSEDVLASVLDRIDHLYKAGIFKDAPPPLDRSDPIHVYDIHSIGRAEQQMFVEILLEDLWQEAKARGQVNQPDTFIVIDEASIFMTDDADHILNILMREARKFGIGLIFASQSVNHFSEDVLANVGLKLILGVDQMFVGQLARMLRVDAKLIDNIRPRATALVQCKVVGDQRNDFTEIFLAANISSGGAARYSARG